MQQTFSHFIKGYLKIRITSLYVERFFNMCAYHGMTLWDVQNHGDSYEMFIGLNDLLSLRPILRKTGSRIKIIGHFGMPFFFQKCRKRFAYVVSLAVCALVIYVLTIFVWQISFTGLERYSEEELLSFLREQNIQYGMRKNDVSCKDLEAAIREAYNDILWVSASLDGTALMIQVKENSEMLPEPEESAPCDVVADVGGTVVQMITRSGVPQVTVGQQVEKGAVLISGYEPRINDSQEVVSYVECHADGDIAIQTTISYEDHIDWEYTKKTMTGKKKTGLIVSFFQKPVTLRNPNIAFDQYTTDQTEQTVVIGESFYLPVSYTKTVYREYTTEQTTYSKTEIVQLANEHFRKFTEELQKNDVEIVENGVEIVLNDTGCTTAGNLTVITPAGEKQPLQEREDVQQLQEAATHEPQ